MNLISVLCFCRRRLRKKKNKEKDLESQNGKRNESYIPDNYPTLVKDSYLLQGSTHRKIILTGIPIDTKRTKKPGKTRVGRLRNDLYLLNVMLKQI